MRIVLALGTGAAAWMVARRSGRARGHSLRPSRSRRLPERVRRPLVRSLSDAGVDIDVEIAIGWWGLAVAVAAMLGAALSPALGVASAAAMLTGAPMMLIARRGRRDHRLGVELPDALGRAASELRAGQTISGALDTLAEGDGPLGADLAQLRRRRARGSSAADALGAWSARRGRDDVRVAAGAFALAATQGGRAADALDTLAASLRERIGVAEEARAQSAQARLSAIVVGGAPLAYFAFATVTDPSTTGVFLRSRSGQICLVVGLALEAVAGWWMHRIVRSTG